jgi:uncharacterized protein YbjT (DUF2867 family)
MSESSHSLRGENLFCFDLPTRPLSLKGAVLVTGASGYIGGRLVPELLARGYRVRVMVRSEPDHYKSIWPQAEVVIADALNHESLRSALRGVHTVFYLIHSLLLGPKRFHHADISAAINVRNAASAEGVQHIIYLGGLGDVKRELSEHLWSRLQVAEELRKGAVPVTILRAAVIIGSGSASYEITHYVVKRVPIIPTPPWILNRCQPIGIRDVIKYLVGCLETPETVGKSFDIGGRDILTYREMMRELAAILGTSRFFIYFPISQIGL